MPIDFKGLINGDWRSGRNVNEADRGALVSKTPSRRSNNLTIAVCNQKGGCAKTTTAVNLAGFLAHKGYKTLLIDLDPQSHATMGVGVDTQALEKSIYDVLIHTLPLEAIIRQTEVLGLDVAPASPVLSGAQIELANILGGETVLRIALRKLRLVRNYDCVILDCSPNLNLITINALVASDSILIPIQTHYYSLEGMKELFSTIEIVKERLNFDLSVLGVVATLFDGRMKINHQVLAQIREYFGELVFRTSIRNSVKLCEAPFHKKPIHLYDAKSNGARDYCALTGELLVRLGLEDAPVPETLPDMNTGSDIAIHESVEIGDHAAESRTA